jgi:alpha-glucosidase
MRLAVLAIAAAVLVPAVLLAQQTGGAPPAAAAAPDSVAVTSPDSSLTVIVETDSTGVLTYRAERFGVPLMTPSKLGVALTDGRRLDAGLRVVSVETAARDTTWETVWGERQFVRDAHREARLTVLSPDSLRMVVAVRVFDGGLALRYEWPAQAGLDSLEIADEVTEFRFAEAPEAWWIPAYQRERYEYLTLHTPLADAGTFQPDANIDTPPSPHPDRPSQVVHTPLTLAFPGSGLFAAVHEAALVDYASMTLVVTDSTGLRADLVPWSTGVKVYATAPHASPWRVVLVGDTPGELAESDLVLNLNEPSRLSDTDWITPQTYIGIWWMMHLDNSTWGSGERHGATTAEARRYIDFAAENGIGGVLVEGWNTGWDGNWTGPGADFSFTEPYPDFDLDAVAAYAREKGVGLIGHHETGGDVPHYEAQLDSAFALYERLGVHAVKTGYVEWEQGILRTSGPGLAPGDSAREWHHGQFMVRHQQRVVETAARHRVMVNIHEPIKDTGLRRTWPNLMTREGGRGMEYNAWSRDGGNPPAHEATLPFTRLLAGPMDYTPGIFDLLLKKGRRPDNRVNTTLAKQLALYVTLYSPLQMAADLPESYAEYADAFQFIRRVPADWSESRVLAGDIGRYVVTARKDRRSDAWYLGAVTDAHGRTLAQPLSFLDPGTTYLAQVYRDADDADWRSNPFALRIESGLVQASDVLPLRLAAGGGLAVRFQPASFLERAGTPWLLR